MGKLAFMFGAALFVLGAIGAPAAAQVTTEPVHFATGETGATIKKTIKGDQIIQYTLSAKKGQSMVVMLTTDNASNYFNVTAPGADSAMFIGSTSGNHFEATLPKSGEYVIMVYLMRNAARRGESATYQLDIGIN